MRMVADNKLCCGIVCVLLSPPLYPAQTEKSYMADMAKVRKYEGKCVGEGENKGQCATFVQSVTGLPLTKDWKRGEKVVGNTALKKGMPIATFDDDGRYPVGNRSKRHAAIFDHIDDDGVIWVWHQYAKGKHPNEVRLDPLSSGGVGINQYYVVKAASPDKAAGNKAKSIAGSTWLDPRSDRKSGWVFEKGGRMVLTADGKQYPNLGRKFTWRQEGNKLYIKSSDVPEVECTIQDDGKIRSGGYVLDKQP